jgi:heme exporter protein A
MEKAGPAIAVAGLRRDYGDRPALDGVGFELAGGASLVVLGPNGAGKTTLLRILATLLRPSSGEVRVLGCALPGEAWKLRGRIGYLGHEPLLYRDLSGRENLRFQARLHGIERVAAEARIEELLRGVGWSAGPTSGSPSSRPGCGSDSRSAAASSTSPSCCCSTSPTPTSTPRGANWPGS